VLPIKAILMNLLSLGAVLGAVVLVWQEGHGSQQIWNISSTGAIVEFIPVMVFAFLYGLSMDYEVFILARVREEYDRTGDTRKAVAEGIGRTGRLVTSAALILFLAFAALAAAPGTEIKIFATALGMGILLDATLVRAVLVPAAMAIMDRANWWMPRPVAFLLRIPRPVPTPDATDGVPPRVHLSPRGRGRQLSVECSSVGCPARSLRCVPGRLPCSPGTAGDATRGASRSPASRSSTGSRR
jgi:RND superfamily putative drug exporter